MCDLRASILVHAIGCKGNREDIAASTWLHQQHRRVLHRGFRAKVAIDPFHRCLTIGGGPLGYQVVHVFRPVLDGRIAYTCALLYADFHDCAMQAIASVAWCGTALNIVYIGTRGNYDQRALELAHILCIAARVGPQRDLNAHPLRHVYEAPPAPHSAVQRCKFVVRWRNDPAEVLLHEVRIQAQSRVHVGKDNTQLLNIFTYLVVDSLTLVLGRHACQELTLGLRYAQAVKSILNLSRYIFPRLTLLLHWLDIIVNFVEINARQLSTPGWYWPF